jgi:transcriptional regulator with XRE-family HTH domain
MKTIAELLREGRARKGMTQLQVADYLGFKSTDRISRWEHGTAEPSAKNLLRLIVLYSVPMADIYEIMAK